MLGEVGNSYGSKEKLHFLNMKNFLSYTLSWISQNLAIPFWMVGHIHLTTNVYEDIYEIIASFGMNLLVAIGFIHDYIKQK
jgi:hypothetical protein